MMRRQHRRPRRRNAGHRRRSGSSSTDRSTAAGQATRHRAGTRLHAGRSSVSSNDTTAEATRPAAVRAFFMGSRTQISGACKVRAHRQQCLQVFPCRFNQLSHHCQHYSYLAVSINPRRTGSKKPALSVGLGLHDDGLIASAPFSRGITLAYENEPGTFFARNLFRATRVFRRTSRCRWACWKPRSIAESQANRNRQRHFSHAAQGPQVRALCGMSDQESRL